MKRSKVAWFVVGAALIVLQLALFAGWRYVLRSYRIPQAGMSPALRPGDLVFARQHVRVGTGDIVTFKYPMDPKAMAK